MKTFLKLYGVLFQILFTTCNPYKISLPALTVGTPLGYSVREPPILGVVGEPLRLFTSPWDSPPSVPLVVVWDIMRLQRRKGSGECTVEAGKAGSHDLDQLRMGRWGGKGRKK